MSTELCNEDFFDRPTGLLFRAGTYTREFRDFCLRTRHMPIEERQRMFRSRHKQGSRSAAPETRDDGGGLEAYRKFNCDCMSAPTNARSTGYSGPYFDD